MIRLHDYWRSGAAYRVRIALNLKGVPYEALSHDLRTGAQRDPSFLAVNPQGLVPALEINGACLIRYRARNVVHAAGPWCSGMPDHPFQSGTSVRLAGGTEYDAEKDKWAPPGCSQITPATVRRRQSTRTFFTAARLNRCGTTAPGGERDLHGAGRSHQHCGFE